MKMFSATLEIGEQARMLVHDRDAVALRVERCVASSTGSPSSSTSPASGPIDAGQQLDAGALAGAVLAQQRQHLAGMQLQRHVADGDRAAERLGDTAQRRHGAAKPRFDKLMGRCRFTKLRVRRHMVWLASLGGTMAARHRLRKPFWPRESAPHARRVAGSEGCGGP